MRDDSLSWLQLGLPRSRFFRDMPFFLNGKWTMNSHEIIVPFPPEAPASHWSGEKSDTLFYETRFDVPPEFLSRRVFLHFGAVDQIAKITINGQILGEHTGGYLPFFFEVSGMLKEKGNLLEVTAVDTLSIDYPYGKQTKNPHGMWYTSVSGIWKSVWMESVPESYIKDVTFETNRGHVRVYVETDGDGTAEIRCDSKVVKVNVNEWSPIEIDHPHFWSPEDPFLYPVEIRYHQDCVKSYFAIRDVEILTCDDGKKHICLNQQPCYLHGLLDQGYFESGILQPGDPAALEKDILRARELGFNCLRKHIKIELDAFYAYCDLHGMLVIQDMVNSGPYHYFQETILPNLGIKLHKDKKRQRGERETFFESHCQETQRVLSHHPSIIGYTVFNEGWGQYDTSRIVCMLRDHDPSRFYISASGWYHGYDTDVESEHVYFRKRVLKPAQAPMMLGECGGFPCDCRASAAQKAYGYGKNATKEELMARITDLYETMVKPSIRNGLNGCIYTQLTDVEGEINGLYTYDRQQCKVDKARMLKIAKECQELFHECVGSCAEET